MTSTSISTSTSTSTSTGHVLAAFFAAHCGILTLVNANFVVLPIKGVALCSPPPAIAARDRSSRQIDPAVGA